MKTRQLQLNAPLRGFPAGAVVAVAFENGVITDPYWRARMEDARRDGCVELVVAKNPAAKHRKTRITGPDETKSPDKITEKKG